MDGPGMIRPQMVESHETSADGLTWNFSLREGLRFHDGAPSRRPMSLPAWNAGRRGTRWAPCSGPRRPSWWRPTPRSFRLVLDVLGKPNAPLPAILPARPAAVPVGQRIREIIGSGPFRFKAADWRPGNVMVLRRFADDVPRAEPADFLAGGKRVHLDAVNPRVMPDSSTDASALMAGEVDHMQFLPFDLLPRLERARGARMQGLGGFHQF